MHETPGEALRRVRRETRTKVIVLCKLLATSPSMLNYVERGLRKVPSSWLKRLPPEFAPVLEAMINDLKASAG